MSQATDRREQSRPRGVRRHRRVRGATAVTGLLAVGVVLAPGIATSASEPRSPASAGVGALSAVGRARSAAATAAVASETSTSLGKPAARAASSTGPAGCSATLTVSGGTPWRRGTCASPGYANTRIRSNPVLDRRSTSVVAALPAAMLNFEQYGEAIYFAWANVPLRRIICSTYACSGGNRARVDGRWRPSSGSDGQLTVVDLAARRTYEFWRVERDAEGTVKVNRDGSVRAAHMSVAALDGRGNVTPGGGRLASTGAGLSRIFGVISAADLRAVRRDPASGIQHALQISLPWTKNCASYRSPATKSDGFAWSTSCVPEGARVQLDPSVNCAKIRGVLLTKAICYALQKYGAYTLDNNGSSRIAFSGQTPGSTGVATSDYTRVGISYDYQDLSGLPVNRLRVLRSWDGS